MYTLNRHVKWRVDHGLLLICDCKRLIALPSRFEETLKKFERGFKEEDLQNEEKLLYLDCKKANLLGTLEIRQLEKSEFEGAMEILDKELKDRQRDNNFLLKKFEQCPKFFIGAFLDNEIVGVICGFPREDYLVISELAVDFRFQRRGFGTMLVREFERNATGYKKIRVGAVDSAIDFYKSLGYKPFLLVQYKKGCYSGEDFKELHVTKETEDTEYKILEVKVNESDLELLVKLREKYPDAYFQYVFSTFLTP